jgi:type II secretory ATPase GspE/PulE/Tfp pilus assembly ATPase PilB-like protein
MRVSTFPTVHGEKAVVRVFHPAAELLDLDQLGLPPEVHRTLAGLLNERSGAVFLTGPSGSGKTTTIYACLRRLTRGGTGRHIVTIEDPVEQWVAGVSQSQARPGTEFDFARGLRSLLRQDPDVIMVGEVRDPETAAVATEAALTGHLVISTLHAGSACGVVGRLLEMGVEPYILTSGVKGILNQRLLRRLCEHCRRPAETEDTSQESGVRGQESGVRSQGSGVGQAAPLSAGWQAVGCERCAGTGYRGRFLVAELLTPNAEFRRAILAKADTDALEAVAARSGWPTIRAAAETAVAAGRTTAEEVARVLGPQ